MSQHRVPDSLALVYEHTRAIQFAVAAVLATDPIHPHAALLSLLTAGSWLMQYIVVKNNRSARIIFGDLGNPGSK